MPMHVRVIPRAIKPGPGCNLPIPQANKGSIAPREHDMQRRYFVFSTLAAAVTTPAAHAATEDDFSPAAFAAAQQAGKPILLHVTAPWCPTCAAQKPILGKLSADAAFKDLVILRIDFDTKKDLLRTMNVRAQRTLIVYRGATELGRSTGDTNSASVTALVRKSIA